MAACKKCGYNEDLHLCKLCGAKNQTLGNFGGKMLTICCQKDPTKTPRGGNK
jgi:RNA polymerase subunit RPABC4/transcription elongation factor Spt4